MSRFLHRLGRIAFHQPFLFIGGWVGLIAVIVAILVINGPISGEPNLSDLTIGGASNAFEGFLGGTSPTVGPIKPGGVFLLAAGDAAGIGTVGAGSTDELRISAGAGGDATYQIAIIARSA